MPLYEYECDKCGQRFELLQKFSDRPVRKCPECGGRVQRLISAPAIRFKGSGWYVTDYAKKPQPDAKEGSDRGESQAGGGESKAGGGKLKKEPSKESPKAASGA